nr:hypothetical protein [Tanacetum cinerariifolium]
MDEDLEFLEKMCASSKKQAQSSRRKKVEVNSQVDEELAEVKKKLAYVMSKMSMEEKGKVETKEEIRDLTTTIKGVEDTTTKVETSTALDKGTDSVVKTKIAGQAGKAPQITSIKELAFSQNAQGNQGAKMTTSSTNNSVFRGCFEKQKLTGPNFIDWYRQLRIMLSIEDKLNYLEQPIPYVPLAPAGQQVSPEILAAHTAWVKGSKEIQVEHELLQTTRDFHSCRQEEGQSNYNMHSMGKIVNELHAMLKLHEQTLLKSNAPALNAIRAGKVQKGNKHKKSHFQKGAKGQNQEKGKFVPKPKIPHPPKRENPAKDSICHECGEI